ncbi:hypothetical protein SUGI_0020280 [Cryptomeria japonica]|nr:hypothetical protein SUGI_0020280 [Cryptomeria japonica]
MILTSTETAKVLVRLEFPNLKLGKKVALRKRQLLPFSELDKYMYRSLSGSAKLGRRRLKSFQWILRGEGFVKDGRLLTFCH